MPKFTPKQLDILEELLSDKIIEIEDNYFSDDETTEEKEYYISLVSDLLAISDIVTKQSRS